MDDLVKEFLTEAEESLEALDRDIVLLERNPGEAEIIRNIFRVMHTLKGTSGFLGLARLEKVAHAAENIMDQLRDGKFRAGPGVVSLILEAIDVVKSIVLHLGETGGEPEGDDSGLIARLNECAETGEAPGGSAAAPAAAPPPPLSKTSDLDGEIDFEPVLASYAAPAASPAAPQEAAPLPAAPMSEQDKQRAVKEGLKIAEEELKKSAAGQQAGSQQSGGQSIRVGIEVLEGLMQMVGELVLTRNQLLQLMRGQGGSQFVQPLQRLNLITSELQEGVMKTRMQPIGNAWSKFPRLIRDLSLELGKKLELKMDGAETDLDRQMLEAIRDPLTHMVRNSADHGIETPRERLATGKPETGTVTLSAYHEGGHIIIKVADDGKGLNVDKIKAKAIQNGLADAAALAAMSDKQIYQFIFRAGFSTAEKVTAVSGRGVGMDVVVSNVEKIGGTVEVNSRPGKGSEFLVRLPLTLAIMPVLIVESRGERFAIPQIRVSEIVRAGEGESISGHRIETINNAQVLRLRGRLLPLVPLASVLHLPDHTNAADKKTGDSFIVVCEVGSHHFGILLDRVFHTEEIVVKPVSPALKHLSVYSGCTILGDGSVIMILDPAGIVKTGQVSGLHADHEAEDEAGAQADKGDAQRTSFLLFRAWGKAPKAVPLELVARLEEIDLAKAEWSGEHRVIQYRGGLMRLVAADASAPVPQEGKMDVIVFNDGERVLGLLVEAILDIARAPMQLQAAGAGKGLLGSMVIGGAATDLIDISWLFSNAFDGWMNVTETKMQAKRSNAKTVRAQHVLLVDDSPFFRKFMKPVLVVADYKVTTADDAFAALKLLDGGAQFDLIVTDIDMPGMSGIEFVQKCRAEGRHAALPFVALTSNTESNLGEHRKLFDGYVSKSDRDRLVTVIGEVLSTQPETAGA